MSKHDGPHLLVLKGAVTGGGMRRVFLKGLRLIFLQLVFCVKSLISTYPTRDDPHHSRVILELHSGFRGQSYY
jgi:hypothetical protein